METSEEKKCCENKKCCCFCHKVPGVLIALIGFAILLGALEVISAKAAVITVAVLIILFGLKKTCSGMCKCCDKP
jgi:hypothetical protein